MLKALFLSFLFVPAISQAQFSRAVMEGMRTSDNTVLISTRTKRVLVSTTVYNGAIPNVGIYTSSNVVISDQASNKCVIYATGAISCLTVNGALSGNAATATALAANGSNCAAGLYPLGVDSSGASESCSVVASSANALSQNPSNCSAGNYPLGVNSFGEAESCTAAGDVIASVNNIFTAQNRFQVDTTFTDSVYISAVSTIGPQGYASAVTKSSGTLNNLWQVVASSYPSTTISSITFTGLTINKRYRLHWSFNPQAASYGYLRFNQDVTATVYDWTYRGVNSNSGAAVINGDNSDPACRLHEANAAAQGGAGSSGSNGYCDIYTAIDNAAFALCNTVVVDGNPFIENSQASCWYYGGSAITSVQFAQTASAGINGVFYFQELIVPNP